MLRLGGEQGRSGEVRGSLRSSGRAGIPAGTFLPGFPLPAPNLLKPSLGEEARSGRHGRQLALRSRSFPWDVLSLAFLPLCRWHSAVEEVLAVEKCYSWALEGAPLGCGVSRDREGAGTAACGARAAHASPLGQQSPCTRGWRKIIRSKPMLLACTTAVRLPGWGCFWLWGFWDERGFPEGAGGVLPEGRVL